jgi:hypothetical protein
VLYIQAVVLANAHKVLEREVEEIFGVLLGNF